MVFLDGTALNIALPVLQAEFRATIPEVQWIVAAYALFLAALMLVGGSLGDYLGRRRVYGLGVGIFAFASLLCGLSQDVTQLVVARAAQGIGGALLVPASLALINATFPAAERGRAIGTWSAFSAVPALAGPLLGGWLIEVLSWRWIFFINLPLAACVLAVLVLRVPAVPGERAAGRPDWWGALLASLGLGAIVFALIRAAAVGFGAPIVHATLAAGGLGLVLFVIHESRASQPMMPLWLFRSRGFSSANLLTLLLYGALGGAFFFLPFNLIQVQGYTTLEAGAALSPTIVLIFLLSRSAGALLGRVGARWLLTVGPLIAAGGFFLFALPGIGGSYWTTFFPAAVALGAGMAITIAPLVSVVFGAVDPLRSGVAAGVNITISRVASLMAVPILAVVAFDHFNRDLDRSLARLALSPPALAAFEPERTKLAAAQPPPVLGPGAAAALSRAIDEAFVYSFRRIMLIAAALGAPARWSAYW